MRAGDGDLKTFALVCVYLLFPLLSFTGHKAVFLLAKRGDICQVCSWQKIQATQRGINTQSSGG